MNKRNPIAKALAHPMLKRRVVPDKRQKVDVNLAEKEKRLEHLRD